MKNIYLNTFLICTGLHVFIGMFYMKEIEAGGDMDGLIFFGRKIEIVFCAAVFSGLLAFIHFLIQNDTKVKMNILKKIILGSLVVLSCIAYCFLCASIVWQ